MVRLTLARKAALLGSAAIFVVAATMYLVTRQVILPRLEDAERDEVLEAAALADRTLEGTLRTFASVGRVVGSGHNLEELSSVRGQQPPASPFDYAELKALEWNAAAFVSLDGKVLWGGESDHRLHRLSALTPAIATLLRSFHNQSEAGAPRASLVAREGQVWMVAGSQLPNARASEKASPAGYLVYARKLDIARPAQLENRQLAFLTLRPPASPPRDAAEATARKRLATAPDRPAVAVVSERELRGFLLKSSGNGSGDLLLEVSVPRRLAATGQLALGSLFWGLGVGGLLVLAFFVWWIGYRIINPLVRLRDAVKKLERGRHSPLIFDREDELGELAIGFNRMARTMRERETTLRQAHAELKLILDSTADTLCGCTLTGAFRGKPSAMGPLCFGEPTQEQDVAAWLFGDEVNKVSIFRMGLEQIREDRLPLAVALDQMPARFARNDRTYDILYHPIREGDDLIGLLLVIKDITAKLAAERAERESRELQIVLGNVMRDRSSFDQFVGECESLLQALHTETDLSQRLVQLHTLKSACSIFGLLSFSEACRELEAQVLVNAEAMNEQALRTLRRTLRTTLNQVNRLAPTVDEHRLSIGLSDYSKFVELVEQRLSHDRLLAEAIRLPTVAAERLLAPLVQQGQRLAQELGKRVEFEIDDGGLRLLADSTRLFWSALAHGINNAIEHGIESPEERTRAGKPPHGTVRIVLRERGEHLVVSVVDDGRGIDWNSLAKKAYQHRLPSTREDLVVLLFTEGLSTKDDTQSYSGRGIGLSALRATCHALGGTCVVHSDPQGPGTELRCTISRAVACQASAALLYAESCSRLSLNPSASQNDQQPPIPASNAE